jgi:hypothetical protein
MSYTFLLEQGEESSAESFSGIPASARSRSTSIAGKSSSNGNGTGSSRAFPSGTMSKPLMESPGEDSWTSSAGDSPARTSPAPEGATDSTGNGADSGMSSPGSLARYDPVTHSLRTAQCLLFEEGTELLRTLPRWGFLRGGELFPLPTPERLTAENGSGYLLPTPSAESYGTNQGGSAGRVGPVRPSLQTMAKNGLWPTPIVSLGGGRTPDGKRGRDLASIMQGRWPTPNAFDANKVSLEQTPEQWQARREQQKAENPNLHDLHLHLAVAVKMWPTPVSKSDKGGRMGLDGGNHARTMLRENHGSQALKELTGGSLNPEWVAWLMGWPLGWTSLEPLATDKFRQWLRSHGEFCNLNQSGRADASIASGK